MYSHKTGKIIIILLFLYPLRSPGQFDKYKTTTTPAVTPETSKSTPPSAPPPPPAAPPAQVNAGKEDIPSPPTESTAQVNPNTPPPAPNNTSNSPSISVSKDSFGRDSSIRVNKTKDNKYVNLNPETAFGPEVVTNFEFTNISLKDLTDQMQKLTGINLILRENIEGSISISAPKSITVGEAWKAYLTALNLHNYGLEKSGAFYKIVKTNNNRGLSPTIYTGSYTPDTENTIMKIISLKYINASEVVRALGQFTRARSMREIRQTNTIIVVDTGKNINRLIRLIKMIDVPGYEESLQIVPIKNASAQEIAKLLDEILRGNTTSRRGGSRRRQSRNNRSNISRIIAEPRTNSIIAMATAQGARQLKELIAKLDVQNLSNEGGRIHVYYLNHADAEELHGTLTGLTAESNKNVNNRQRRNQGPFSSEGNSIFSSSVKITADKSNNALVITASPTDYLTIKNVIDKLDIQKDQVYVEGLIMETFLSKSLALGTSIAGIYGEGNASKAGFQESSESGLQQLLYSGNPLSLGGFFGGFGLGRVLTIYPDGQNPVKVNSVNGLIKAIASNGNTNILATPQILALDNTEAIFEAGENVPVPTQNTTTTGGTTTSIRYEPVKLSLKITPYINKVTRFIKLDIDQNIGEVSTRTVPAGVADQAIGTTTRSAVTTVVVRDRDTIAMGGLMRDTERSELSKVPFLGDIPLLGWLFKHRETTVNKMNMIFFLTPKILANYQRDNAENIKDLLNRRNYHLKDTQGEDDPFKTSVKGLYQKAQDQSQGPLFDESETQKYRDSNEGNIRPEQTEDLEDDFAFVAPPNYKEIVREIEGLE